MRALAGLLMSAALMAPAVLLGQQRFFPDDPLRREPPPHAANDPGARNLSLLLETVSATFGRPGDRHPANGVIAAQGANTLGDVLDGPWYVNRHGRERMSLEALRRGSGNAEPPSTAQPWRVLLARAHGGRPTLVFRDADRRVYALRFDPAGSPEMATGAEMISSRIFHALGYHIPESYLVAFERSRLLIEDNASDVTTFGELRELLPDDIDRLLAQVHRGKDGRYRGIAVRVPRDAESLIGPFQLFGTRNDDPNDIVPHEHRRDLRGLHVFAAWVNHTRFDPLHTMDVVVQPQGESPHIRHYLYDFMATLGSAVTGPKPAWEGHDPIYAKDTTLANIAGLGFYTPAWMRVKYPGLPAIGRFESGTFEPEAWTTIYEVAPFANRLPDDTYWAARQVMRFTDEEIRAIVATAEYSDPEAARWIADCLIDRRNRIGRTYLSRVLPLDDVTVRDGELAFTDLGVRHGFAKPRRFRVEWRSFDNLADKAGARLDGAGGTQIPGAAAGMAAGSYVVARVTAEGEAANLALVVYLRKDAGGWQVVGLDREWPGRVLVNPHVDIRPARNRYAELEPERRTLFDDYSNALNAKSGERLSPEERFRAISISEQTTYDGVTHALMESSLTDPDGRSLGRALDLVVGLDRIAGQQAGRTGDQQFRLYVRLRPEARATLERSREFFADHLNTVYHPGYPYSFRLGAGVPSVQFSLAEDGLSADVDVDYRASKMPQSLFNGHLTSSNSDVRAGDNAQRHNRRWNGFINWWSELFGQVSFAERSEAAAGPFGAAPTRPATALPPNRLPGATISELADAAQEFFTDWLVRRNYREAVSFFAPDVYPCVAESSGLDPKSSPDRLRQASLALLEEAARLWGRPRNLTEAMNPVVPWSPRVRVVKHAYDRDFTIVEAPTELGRQYECGATPPKKFEPSTTPEYGTYYGVLLEVVHGGVKGGTVAFLWRRVAGEWRLVAYRVIE